MLPVHVNRSWRQRQNYRKLNYCSEIVMILLTSVVFFPQWSMVPKRHLASTWTELFILQDCLHALLLWISPWVSQNQAAIDGIFVQMYPSVTDHCLNFPLENISHFWNKNTNSDGFTLRASFGPLWLLPAAMITTTNIDYHAEEFRSGHWDRPHWLSQARVLVLNRQVSLAMAVIVLCPTHKMWHNGADFWAGGELRPLSILQCRLKVLLKKKSNAPCALRLYPVLEQRHPDTHPTHKKQFHAF